MTDRTIAARSLAPACGAGMPGAPVRQGVIRRHRPRTAARGIAARG